jgi:predicted acetyltransferase
MSQTTLTFRPIAPGESMEAFFDLDDLTFHGSTPPARRAVLSEQLHRDGTLCAYDEERLVGSSQVSPAMLSVPGAQLDCGALSWVGVAPTHRRRGILRTMMGAQLSRLAEAGTPLAALWASEATIYGRFGYGVATWDHSYEIRARDRDSGVRAAAQPQGVRLIDREGAEELLGDIYDRHAELRAGVLSRDQPRWTHDVLAEADSHDDGKANELRIALTGDPADGYVLYRVGRDPEGLGGAGALIEVAELVALTPAAALALWSFVLSIDLVGRVTAPHRPVDDPLGLMLINQRTARRTQTDALWVRLIDLPRALAGRHWTGTFDLVLEVEDVQLSANSGLWQLSSDAGPARCVRTDRRADLSLSIAQLGTIYLGGGSLTGAVDAGLVVEHTPGAAERLDQGARSVRAPWNISVF